MGADGKYRGPYHKEGAGTLNALVDFGPDHSHGKPHSPHPQGSPDVTDRLRRLVQQVKEISQRIDDLFDR